MVGPRTSYLRARRRCLVCEGEQVGEELDGTDAIGTPCVRCHAPTERLEILARHAALIHRNPHAAALGRLGGLRGGPARAASLSAQRRREIAAQGARARWQRRSADD